MKLVLLVLLCLYAAVFGSVRGIVHDPDHRPVAGAHISIRSTTSDFSDAATTDGNGAFKDNSQTFGGTHYADPRQIYVQLRYRFHY